MINQLTADVRALPLEWRKDSIHVITLRSSLERRRFYFTVKRVFDVIFSAFVVIFLLSWLTFLLGIVIKINSPGPIFFSQRRVGKNGKIFRCLKFRSMVINTQADDLQAVFGDTRITRVGRFIRTYNIDELPQFWNVLMGDMSIIGPRPHMLSDCSRFSGIVKGYKLRTVVRPGITGLAQSKGYHGPAATSSLIVNRFRWDAYYVRNAGFLLDLKILQITIAQRISLLFRLI